MRCLIVLAALLAPALAEKTKKSEPRTVDLVICLDVSGSMDGLIHSARARIWSIVNDLALAKPTPRLRVGVIAYGATRFDPAAGWVSVETAFTEDLDLVSKKLFGLTTGGGTELVGRALQKAMTLTWQTRPDALRIILVAGNESADQDQQVPFRDMCKAAIARGIMVNPIYCRRTEDAAIADGWRDIARLADGHYASIDQQGTVDITSPFDERLAALNAKLNETYLWYGLAGKRAKESQVAEDRNAAEESASTAALRTLSKRSALYWNRNCLIDALDRKEIKLADVKEADLPEKLRGKTREEQRKIVDGMRAERARIRNEIEKVGKSRAEWLVLEMKKRNQKDEDSFDAVVRTAIRGQARKKGYRFADEAPKEKK